MLQSQMLIDTKKESPAEDASISSEYLVRGGFIDRVASGIYTFLPLGFLVLKKMGYSLFYMTREAPSLIIRQMEK